MEVSGRKADADPDKTSSDDIRAYCEPCGADGKRVTVHGYCQTCAEFLCMPCYTCHKIPKPMKHHVLLDKVAMPTRAIQEKRKEEVICSVPCPKHPTKIVEFYCPAHAMAVCGSCAVLNHKPCQTDHIPEVAKNYKNNREYKGLANSINILEEKASAYMDTSVVNLKNIDDEAEKVIDDVKLFRAEINAYVDRIENELLSKIEKMKKPDQANLNELKNSCEKIKSEITEMQANLQASENESGDLYIATKQILDRVTKIESGLESLEKKNKVYSYTFKSEQCIVDIIVSQFGLGSIERTEKQIKIPLKEPQSKATKDLSINVKVSEDKEPAFITGSVVLSPGILLLADGNNKCIKKVDTSSNMVTATLRLSSKPWDITTIGKDQAAVTLPAKYEIQIITTNDGLSVGRKINVTGKCYGIDSFDDKLAVSYFDPANVEVINEHGEVLHEIRNDAGGNPLFQEPAYVAVSNEEGRQLIIVSDLGSHTITKLSMDGKVLMTYKDKDLSNPQGLAVLEDGQIIACSWGNNKIVCVPQRSHTIRTLLDTTEGMEYPRSVSYCPVENKMYVGCAAKRQNEFQKYLKVYKFQ